MLTSELISKHKYAELPSKFTIILADALDETLSLFGEKTKDVVISDACDTFNINPTDFFKDFEIVRKSIINIFGKKASKIVFKETAENLSRRLNHSSFKSLDELVEENTVMTINSFFQSLKGHEHIICLWKNPETITKILDGFFSSKNFPKICFGVQTPMADTNIAFEELFSHSNPIQFETDKINTIHSSNHSKHPTMVAAGDCTKWFDDGHTEKFLAFEESLGKYFEQNNVCGLCGFDVTQINDDAILERLLPCFDYLILDDPHSIYKRDI